MLLHTDISYKHMESPWGKLTLAASPRGLFGIWFEGQKHHPNLQNWVATPHHPLLADAEILLQDFWQKNLKFGTPARQALQHIPIDLHGGTVFQQAVWQALLAIPMGAKLHHIKLHGALYNDCAKDPALSKIFIQTIQAINPDLIVYGLSGSHTIQQAILLGQPFSNEAFADRTYQLSGQLTPRYMDNAMINDPSQACDQVLRMIIDNKVATLNGEDINIEADTICIHGDGANAVAIATTLYDTLKNNNIEIKYP